jgi:hypothetical protein
MCNNDFLKICTIQFPNRLFISMVPIVHSNTIVNIMSLCCFFKQLGYKVTFQVFLTT